MRYNLAQDFTDLCTCVNKTPCHIGIKPVANICDKAQFGINLAGIINLLLRGNGHQGSDKPQYVTTWCQVRTCR